ncbi:MAG: hypothetical protein H6550_10985 [Chitinophagales bacterium]|nr:hypothetical protein [Chitinophagales bacterium]
MNTTHEMNKLNRTQFLLALGLFLISSIAVSSCNVNGNRVYPKVIEKYGLMSQYDASKWYLYCVYCDKQPDFLKGIIEYRDSMKYYRYVPDTMSEEITYGQLELKLDRIELVNDTTNLYFSFYHNGEKITPDRVNTPPYAGTMFIGDSDTIFAYRTYGDMAYFMVRCDNKDDCNYREVIPEQPEVIQYIRNNKNNLNDWFKYEANRRGIILK